MRNKQQDITEMLKQKKTNSRSPVARKEPEHQEPTDLLEKKKEKSPGSAAITNRSPSKAPRGRGNRQIQTSTNRTNVRKALRLALSSPSEVIAMLKGLKNTRKK